MKILHVVPGLKDPTCGIAVAAKMIARQQASEHEVVTRDFREKELESAAYFEGFDEIWVHSMWTPWVMRAAFFALRAGKRLVRMPHGCMDGVKIRHHFYKKMWVMPIEKWLMSKASAIVGTIPDEIEQIKAFVPRFKGEIVLRSLVGGFGAARELGQTARRSDRLLYIGRLHPLKGVEFLIRAMDERHSLVVIGKDEGEGEKLKALAKELGAKVDFRGVVCEEEKNAAFEECDMFVLPTLSENFGLVVAEALERGKRVITTDGAPAWADFPGLVYLKGYRDGSEEARVRLLRDALKMCV